MPRRCETSRSLSYLDRMLASAHFSCQAGSFQEWRLLCMTQNNVCSSLCAVSHHYHSTSCPHPHCLLLKSPLHALGTHQHSSLQPIYHFCPIHATAIGDNTQPSDQVVCTCCKEISVLRDQLLCS